jgi:hypothetical protein
MTNNDGSAADISDTASFITGKRASTVVISGNALEMCIGYRELRVVDALSYTTLTF